MSVLPSVWKAVKVGMPWSATPLEQTLWGVPREPLSTTSILPRRSKRKDSTRKHSCYQGAPPFFAEPVLSPKVWSCSFRVVVPVLGGAALTGADLIIENKAKNIELAAGIDRMFPEDLLLPEISSPKCPWFHLLLQMMARKSIPKKPSSNLSKQSCRRSPRSAKARTSKV